VHPGDAARWSHVDESGSSTPAVLRQEIAAQARALNDRGIHFVDATLSLIESGDEERMYHWLDIHLTRAGNAVVASAASPVVQALADRRFKRP